MDIRKQNSMGNQKNKPAGTGCRKASALLLAAVTALSPLSAQATMQNGFHGFPDLPGTAAAAASADPSESAETAETADLAGTAGSEEAAETAATAASAENVSAAATGQAAETADPSYTDAVSNGREIFVHLAEAPEDPVPAKVMDTDTASLLKLVSEGLTVLDENNNPAPGCAESWDVSEDGLQWTFHLRDDLKWSDGFSMKASDFVLLFRKTADTATEALYGPELTQNIAGYEDVLDGDVSALQVSAPDDHTFVVNLTTPDPDFAKACASWSLLPVREQIREDFDDEIPADWNYTTGNGPYYIDAVTWGEEYILRKNPYYKDDKDAESADENDENGENDDGAGAGDLSSENSDTAFDTVHWIVSGDINEEYSDFLNGDIDAISAIPEEEERLLETENMIHRKNLPDTMGICFNCRHQVLSDSRVRRALSLAVDRTFIAETILQDVYQPEAGDGKSEDGDLKEHTHEAKELLEEAGYKDGEGIPELTCIAEENGGALLTAQYLASAWRDLGIDVNVEAVKAEDLAQEKKAGTFDIFCGSLFLASDLPSAELAGFTSDNENNISGFSSQEYDLLAAEASEIADEEEYAEAMQRAFDILREEVPVAPLVTKCVSWLRQYEYPGISCDSTGCWLLEDIGPTALIETDGSTEEIDEEENDTQDDTQEDAADDTEAAADTADTGDTALNAGGIAGNTTVAEDSDSDSTDEKGSRGVSVTAQIPAGRSAAGQDSASASLPLIEADGTVRRTEQNGSKTGTALDLVRSSDFYFEKTSQQAYLTRQAWLYNRADETAQRVVSLPKYTEVHLTGIGNSRFVRIAHDGKTCYVDANKVSSSKELIEALHAQEKEGLAEKAVLTASLHSVKENELEDRAADARARTEEVLEAIARREMLRTQTRNPNWNGPVLSRGNGSIMGPSGKETYYNLNMNGVVNIMRRMGNMDEYWVRDDGCKMLGDYIMCAANLRVHPRGSLVECSLGTCIVCDTGGFASRNSHQLDIAVTW